MIHKLFIVCSAIGLAMTALSIVLTAALGLMVWLGGTQWVRRPPARPPNSH